ncbi:SDR family NAD(P)-dependent oxidoreductase [Streptomyces flaveolus]|uniref:SDR family NAD(P)-dependent oxidoreductase n=1 Tax=Streptomyces flaveolus TaxID=67297 RepID=UPI00381F118F
MSRILVTGSADGLGRAAADALLSRGHRVVVHARNPERANGPAHSTRLHRSMRSSTTPVCGAVRPSRPSTSSPRTCSPP